MNKTMNAETMRYHTSQGLSVPADRLKTEEVNSASVDEEEEQNMKEVIQILQQQILLKSRELTTIRQELTEKFNEERDKVHMEHSNTKMQLAQTKTALLDLEDFVDGYKE